jgi:hypothetical protein
MHLSRVLVTIGVLAALLGFNVEILRAQQSPSIEFGGAQVSLGMTVEQVKTSLAESGRQIQFLTDNFDR